MRAVTIVDTQLRWEERSDPEPAGDELLVAVRAAGINGADLLQRRGFYPPPPGSPVDIPGMELAGEVVAVGGSVSRFRPGDRVMGLVGGGAQAELATIPEEVALAVPEGIGWAEAGGFMEVFSTAHDALFTQGRLQPGDRVLISGAAGGVGTAAVQLARAAGATVVASVRSEAMRDQVRALGADLVIEPDGTADHGPYDVVLELVGAPGVEPALGALAIGARVVVIGVGAGAKVELNLLVLMNRRATIGGSTLRARPVEEKADVVRGVGSEVLPRVTTGEIRVPVAATYPMSEANAGYERFAAGGKLGKVVLLGD